MCFSEMYWYPAGSFLLNEPCAAGWVVFSHPRGVSLLSASDNYDFSHTSQLLVRSHPFHLFHNRTLMGHFKVRQCQKTKQG